MGFAATAAQTDVAYNAAQGEASQYQFNAKSEMIAADQAEAQRRADLISTLGAVDAVRTSRGLDVASPTGQAIAGSLTKRAESGISTERLNYLTKAQSDLFGAQNAQLKGDAALIGGFLQAGQQVAGAAGAGGFG